MPKLIALVILLAACNGKSPTPVPPPVIPETFEQQLFRTERVTCPDITYHDYGETPDCRRVYEAFVRARNRVAQRYPQAHGILISTLGFYRPPLKQVPERPWPIFLDNPSSERGATYYTGGVLITYSYEETIEHEAIHALMYLVDGSKLRELEAMAQDPNAGTGTPQPFLYMAACHGTPDDPFGEPGKRDSCVEPFKGPADWRERIPQL